MKYVTYHHRHRRLFSLVDDHVAIDIECFSLFWFANFACILQINSCACSIAGMHLIFTHITMTHHSCIYFKTGKHRVRSQHTQLLPWTRHTALVPKPGHYFQLLGMTRPRIGKCPCFLWSWASPCIQTCAQLVHEEDAKVVHESISWFVDIHRFCLIFRTRRQNGIGCWFSRVEFEMHQPSCNQRTDQAPSSHQTYDVDSNVDIDIGTYIIDVGTQKSRCRYRH